jgi:PAS domain S-box-containing protein
MSQLRKTLHPIDTGLSPAGIVLLVILMQVILISAFYYLAERKLISFEPAELVVLLVYSVIAVAVSLIVALMRMRWMQSENRVRQRLLDIIDAIPDPSSVRDMKGKYVMWNKAAESYHGIKAEHVVGKTPFDLFPKEVARNLLELDAECANANQPMLRRVVLPPLYGKGQRVAQIRSAPIQSASDSNASGNIRGVVTILHDATESERETTSLRQLSAQLKMALDTSGFGSWTWDLKTNEQIYSPQYQALLRYEGKNFKDDFVFLDRVHPGDAEIVTSEAMRSIKENAAYDQVYRLRCFDEEYRYFHVSGQPVTDAQGKRQFAGLLCPLNRNAA